MSLIIPARGKIIERRHNDRMSLAWHIAALMRQKKLPKLEKLLHRQRSNKPQTPEEMLSIVKMLNAASGGKVIGNK